MLRLHKDTSGLALFERSYPDLNQTTRLTPKTPPTPFPHASGLSASSLVIPEHS